MSRKFLTSIDLSKNQLIQAAVENLAGAPGTPVKGQLYMNTTDNILYWYNGTGWVAAQGGAGAVPATTVTTSAVGDASVVGVATTYAREDHKHAREPFGVAVSDTAFGSAKVDGVSTSVSHADHTHGNPTHVAADHSGFSRSIFAAPTADIAWGGFKITNLGTPAAGTDATNKDYVDNLSAGLSWKDAVRAATTANGTLASAFQNAAVIDGVTLATGNRILLKNQTTTTENGIYTVNASGAPTRATDADASGELDGAAVFVMEGTTLADSAWVLNTNGPIIPGTTGQTWVQFGGGSAISAGAGLTGTTTFDVVADSTITVTADQISRAALTGNVTAPAGSNATTIANGVVSNAMLTTMAAHTFKGNNTGSTGAPLDLSIANMQAELGVAPATLDAVYLKRIAQDCAANVLTTVTHNFNTRDVTVTAYRNSTPWDDVDVDVERPSVNAVDVRFATAPTAAAFRIVVQGLDQ